VSTRYITGGHTGPPLQTIMKNDRVFNCDVLVVGAGAAGVMAAVSAGQAGAKVILVEQASFIGGTAVKAGLKTICGDDSTAGIARRLCRGLKRKRVVMGKVQVLPVASGEFPRALARLIKDTPQVLLALKTKVIAAHANNSKVVLVACCKGNKKILVKPRAVIDASGDAGLVRSAGGAFMESPAGKRQLAGYTVELKGLLAFDETVKIRVPYYAACLVKEKNLPGWLRLAGFIPGNRAGRAYLRINLPDSVSGKAAARYTRRLHGYLAKRLSEFRNSVIIDDDYRVVPRESARVLGQYILTARDVVAGRKFGDVAARGSWPIEFWSPKDGPIYKYAAGGHYDIPAGCLRAKSFDNVFCAGRCISADPIALASARVLGIAMATGEAAGKMAAGYAAQYR